MRSSLNLNKSLLGQEVLISDQKKKNVYLANRPSPTRTLAPQNYRQAVIQIKKNLSRVKKLKEKQNQHSVYAGMRPHIDDYRAQLEKRHKVIKEAIDHQVSRFDLVAPTPVDSDAEEQQVEKVTGDKVVDV